MSKDRATLWEHVRPWLLYLLSPSDFLQCRCVCKEWRNFFSFAALCHHLHLEPSLGLEPTQIIHGIRYLLFVKLWDLHTLETELPFGRCRSAVEHLVQGNLRQVWYEGTLDDGRLLWSVQPSVSWSANGGKGYTVHAVVKNREASIPSCNCPHGG